MRSTSFRSTTECVIHTVCARDQSSPALVPQTCCQGMLGLDAPGPVCCLSKSQSLIKGLLNPLKVTASQRLVLWVTDTDSGPVGPGHSTTSRPCLPHVGSSGPIGAVQEYSQVFMEAQVSCASLPTHYT